MKRYWIGKNWNKEVMVLSKNTRNKKLQYAITESKTALANRSGREWPHNAIYEILTCGCVERDQPQEYSNEQVRAFQYILKSIDVMDNHIWTLVYKENMSVQSVAESLGIGHTSACDRMNRLYRTKVDGKFAPEVIRDGI